MKILFLTPYLPYPPNKGTALRNLYLLQGAARRHEVHLLTFAQETVQEAARQLESFCREVITVTPPRRSTLQRLGVLFSHLPDMAFRLPSTELRRRLGEVLERTPFDLVQVEGLEMAPYGLEVVRRRVAGKAPRLVFDAHNAEHALQRSAFSTDLHHPLRWPGAAYSLIQWKRLQAYEREVCRRADGVLAVSQTDAGLLRALEPDLQVEVVTNGVDTSHFAYRALAGRSAGQGPTILFTGTMDYRPNVDAVVWFCQEILPAIRNQVPQARLLIVGRNPTAAVSGLAGPAVTVTGAVEDVRTYLYQGDVFVAPMRMGSGTRFKVLEAMACGLPVVSTPLGVEGIAVAPGREVLLAAEPGDFASRVVELLGQPSLAQELATRARLLVEHQYDWGVILPRLEEAYRHICLGPLAGQAPRASQP